MRPLPLLLPLLVASAAAQAPDRTPQLSRHGVLDDQLGDPLGDDDDDLDLTDLSLEELMNIDVEVTSVSRKREHLADTAAAVYVITSEDIRRAGALSIPEALRLAPGLHVARLSTGDYAISARGFSGEFANKMLVLIDGRSVYTPLFSGVFWDVQDLAMEDIDRIEVIRGPGGTMWGANAVNGVINIITRRAQSLDGGAWSLLVGNEEQLTGTVRAGGALGEDGHLRVYLKSRDRDGLRPPIGTGIEGDSEAVRGGFRADWSLADGEEFTLQGDVHRTGQTRSIEVFTPAPPFFVPMADMRRFEGGNLLGRWSRQEEDGASSTLQSYFAHDEFESSILDERRDTLNVDFQRQRAWNERNSLIWGMAYRMTRSETVGSPTLSFSPDHRTDHLLSAFVQDEYQASEDLKLIAGTKVEHNEYTGLEVQPNLRFSLARGERSTLWGAVSRAVRTPSQISADLSFLQGVLPGTPPGFNTLIVVEGNDNFESEELIAYELGFRTRPSEATSLDIATFVHTYDNLLTAEFGTATPIGPGTIRQPVFFENRMDGVGYGAEVAGQLVVNEDWTLHASYSLLLLDLDVDPSSTSLDAEGAEDDAPKNQIHVRSLHDLDEKTELDIALFYVDNLGYAIDSYVRGDVRLGWRPSRGTRLSVGVQGLFHDDEPEFPSSEFGEYYGAELGAYVKVDFSF